MKHIFRIFTALFVLFLLALSGSVTLLQTPWAKKQIARHIEAWAASKQIRLSIGAIQGFLPFYGTLKNVHYGEDLCIGELFFSWRPLPDIALHMDISTHFTLSVSKEAWKAKADLRIAQDGSIQIDPFAITSSLATIGGHIHCNKGWQIERGLAHFLIPNLEQLGSVSPLPLHGSFEGRWEQDLQAIAIDLTASDLSIGEQPFSSFNASASVEKEQERWIGHCQLDATGEQFPLQAHATFSFSQSGPSSIDSFLLTAPDTQISGELWRNRGDEPATGTFLLQMTHLNRFQKFIPHTLLRGSLGARIELQEGLLHLHAVAGQLRAGELQFETLYADIQSLDFFSLRQGAIHLEGEKFQSAALQLDHWTLQAKEEKGAWSFQGNLEGQWQAPLKISASGQLLMEDGGLCLNVERFEGGVLYKDFTLKPPCSIRYCPTHLQLEGCDIEFSNGYFHASADLLPNQSRANIQATHLPIGLLSLALPQRSPPSFSGYVSIDAFLDASLKTRQGRANFLLERAQLFQFGKESPLQAKGSLQVNLDREAVQIHTHLIASKEQFLESSCTFPLKPQERTNLLPPLAFDLSRPVTGALTVEGYLEEIFDFINLGSQHLGGHTAGRLFLSNTLTAPVLHGELDIEKGSYENYYSGTHLKNLHLSALAQNRQVRILSLSAGDGKEGYINGRGHLLLDPERHFPFTLETELSDFETLRSDLLTARFSGTLEIRGDTESASISGSVEATHAEIDIPDALPLDIPTLPITYIHPPLELSQAPKSNFPLHIDVEVTAPGRIIVQGRGLRTEWKGHTHLKGTNLAIKPSGTLDLVKGEFLFSGKVFSLTQGEIAFTDQGAFLTLSGTLALPDLTIIALLKGPLTAPLLTFQSMPHLPTSSILARILFDKDISEISAIQAIQLAQVIMTLSGGAAPDVLEAIRKSLGIDRLNLVSSQNGSDQISVQIGKYLTQGLMVTLSQSATSSQVMVEVELKHGFIFQAETQEQEEGKFSLKWHRNY